MSERAASPSRLFECQAKKTGRRIAAYRFASPDQIIHGRIAGRSAFSKRFRDELIERYGSRDALTGERYEPRHLQIDHRVPYEIAGESVHHEDQPDAYMLLNASSQRAKSWSCEHCSNWREGRSEAICRSCFWAFPEHYTHIAGEQIRRIDIEWRGSEEVEVFERIRSQAEEEDRTVAALIKKLLAQALG